MQTSDQKVQEDRGNQEKEAGVRELFEKIKLCVEDGDIREAERLRENLIQLDTMALSQIIASAEMIEEAKLATIDEVHQALWHDLYDRFSPEEKGLFYYSLEEETIPAKTVFIKQGSLSDCLYFVEDGQVDVIFTKEKENHLLLQIGKGRFLGEDTFFGMSVCTSSALSRSEVHVKILKKEQLARWAEEAPGMYAKVESYCREFGQYEDLYERKRGELSRFDRLNVRAQVSADVLNSAMKQTGKTFRATVGDISRGGACFYIKASKKEAARSLLARPLKMIFAVKMQSEQRKFAALGRVVRVKFHLENDYSVHVKFAKPLGGDTLENVSLR